MRHLDNLLNSLTMYKSVLYGLLLLTFSALVASIMNGFSFPWYLMLASLGTLIAVCFTTNFLLSKIFKVPANSESYIISALILFFLITPPVDGLSGLVPLVLASIFAMSSKYVLNIKKKHLFNPSAISAVILGILGFEVSWWVATPVLFPAVLIIGLLVIRKIRKFSLFFAFSSVVVLEMVIFGSIYNIFPHVVLTQLLLSWPFMFFAGFMLTEPLTMPPKKNLQIIYGGLVGFLFAFQLPLGPILLSPELSLVAGNVFSYFVSSKQRIVLTLKNVQKLSSTIYNFTFSPNEKLKFKSGQYVEWTLPHIKPDMRGVRRFFTIASAPTENDIMLGVRISEDGSSFKKALMRLNRGDEMLIGSLAGDFVLPSDVNIKLAFLAGGIGITPFRSMLKYLSDKNEKRDIVLFHLCSKAEDFVYGDTFDNAKKRIGLKIHYLLNDKKDAPSSFQGKFGHLTTEVLQESVPDYKERLFYISGSNLMVEKSKKALRAAGVKSNSIMTDYFSGY